mgnify:CR=1 FL=1|jgi:hypothetical protein
MTNRFLSVSNEDAEFTEHQIRHFIIAKKLGVQPNVSREALGKLNDLWGVRDRDDIVYAEYKQLWYEVEKEIEEANNVR